MIPSQHTKEGVKDLLSSLYASVLVAVHSSLFRGFLDLSRVWELKESFTYPITQYLFFLRDQTNTFLNGPF